ncbi:MAG: hybrid sensor histidine kinase/response regulator transcription factor [Bacteroidales bacterium]|nr:hybrid sensor histidine kinase/response regulator transcription factor [Bacteroidales bacterium]
MNSVSFEFSALHYEFPQGNYYKYKLDKVDNEWVEVKGDRRFVNYSNLKAGNYTFRLKVANNDRVWSEKEKILQIKVHPPFWQTVYAYIFYIALLVLFLFLFRKYSIIRVVEVNNLKMEKLKRAQTEALTKMKLEFFTNISHEIRTPLSLIVDPIEEIKNSNKLDPKTLKLVSLIHNNSLRLMKLVDQIMDFRKFEQGKMKLLASEEDFIKFCNEIKVFFNYTAKSRKINLAFKSTKNSLKLWFDKEKMESVLFNLISNALKYTPNGGEIVMSCDTNESSLIFTISDTGQGISDKNIPHLFERFYQTPSIRSKRTGVGIGLALVKIIIEQHKGTIEVESELNKGTKFTISIPLGNKHLTEEQMTDEKDSHINLSNQLINEEIPSDYPVITEISTYDSKNKTILIVEDNHELREYIKQQMAEDFNIVEAINGQEAYDYVVNNEVDVILSDIMMPVLDGIEFCNLVKTNAATSHIPVILLTARTSAAHRLHGYESGADAYIQKPFSIKLVKARIYNLLKSRDLLKQKFKGKLDIEPAEITFTTYDEKLLKKTIAVIEKNISNPEFGVKELCIEVGISRPQLYRKLIALTDLSVSDFIRSIRLKRAAQILLKDNSSVTEVMYMVGFSNKSYFAKAFKELFGVSPKNYTSNS